MQKTEAIRKIAADHPELWELLRHGRISYREAKKQAGLDSPARRGAVAAVTVEVGTIYRASWGYDQTNIDYYEVVKTTAKSLELRPIAQRRVEATTAMSEVVEPIPGKYTGPSFRRRIAAGTANGVRISSCEWASPWSGRPDYATHYA